MYDFTLFQFLRRHGNVPVFFRNFARASGRCVSSFSGYIVGSIPIGAEPEFESGAMVFPPKWKTIVEAQTHIFIPDRKKQFVLDRCLTLQRIGLGDRASEQRTIDPKNRDMRIK